jgi:hypothetical protein
LQDFSGVVGNQPSESGLDFDLNGNRSQPTTIPSRSVSEYFWRAFSASTFRVNGRDNVKDPAIRRFRHVNLDAEQGFLCNSELIHALHSRCTLAGQLFSIHFPSEE